MSSAAYTLPTPVLGIGRWGGRLLRDGEYHVDPLELEAKVRSGLYFLTLATALEAMLDELRPDQTAMHYRLISLIEELACLQRDYTLTKKPGPAGFRGPSQR